MLRQKRRHLLPAERIPRPAPRTRHSNILILAEQFIQTLPRRVGNHAKYPFIRTTALPPVDSRFEIPESFILFESIAGLFVQGLEPGHVAVGLGGDEEKIFFPQPDEAGRTLLALAVKMFGRHQNIASVEGNDTAPRRIAPFDEVGVEKIVLSGSYIFGEQIANHRAGSIIAGHEQVHERVLKIDRPGHRFIAGPRSAMESNRSDRIFQQLIVLRNMPDAAIGQPQIVIDIQVLKLRADNQRVPIAHKVRSNCQALLRISLFHIFNSPPSDDPVPAAGEAARRSNTSGRHSIFASFPVFAKYRDCTCARKSNPAGSIRSALQSVAAVSGRKSRCLPALAYRRGLNDPLMRTIPFQLVPFLLLLAALPVTPGIAQQPPENATEAKKDVEVANQIGGVRIDEAKRAIVVPCKIELSSGVLEYALVHTKGKLHESLLSTEVQPQDIHVAMLLLGARQTPTSTSAPPGQITADYLANAPKLEGDEVQITARWTDQAGTEQSRPLEDLILDLAKSQTMAHGPWIYNGSLLSSGKFLAQQDGSIIATISDPSALANNPRPGRDKDDAWAANTEVLPPAGTPVELEIQFTQKKKE